MVLLLGLALGSFLNVCIYRIPRNLSIVRPRSFCPGCRKQITWRDNIPVFSYLLLRGKCRHCRRRIPAIYPLVELLTAALVAATVWRFEDNGPVMATALFLTAALLVSTFIDMRHFIIPDEITLPGIALALMLHFSFPSISMAVGRWPALGWSLLGAAAGGGSLLLVAVAGRLLYGKEVMGLGDVKLMAMVGAFLGWKNVLLAIFLGSLIGSIAGVLLMATRKADWRSRIPFGPYLSIGSLLAMWAGDTILAWYMRAVTGIVA